MKIRNKLVNLIDAIGCSQEYLSTLCESSASILSLCRSGRDVSLNELEKMKVGLEKFKEIIQSNSSITDATEQLSFLITHGFKLSEISKRLPFSYSTIKNWYSKNRVSEDGSIFMNEVFKEIVKDILAVYE